jgi:hypothetical protein
MMSEESVLMHGKARVHMAGENSGNPLAIDRLWQLTTYMISEDKENYAGGEVR